MYICMYIYIYMHHKLRNYLAPAPALLPAFFQYPDPTLVRPSSSTASSEILPFGASIYGKNH